MQQNLQYRHVADLMRVSEATVRGWVKKGHLPPPTAHSQNYRDWPAKAVLPHLKKIAQSPWFQAHQEEAKREIQAALGIAE